LQGRVIFPTYLMAVVIGSLQDNLHTYNPVVQSFAGDIETRRGAVL
jgi:hypothetical protein